MTYDDYQYDRSDRVECYDNPDGESVLRKASKLNPRNLPCPSCGKTDKLTPADRALGYQCDNCASRDELGW